MPELPEVEIVVRGLRETILGKTIESIRSNAPKIENDNRPGWLDALKGKRFRAVRRRGKNILIDLSEGYTLWVHLKMTGHLYYLPGHIDIGKHDLLIFEIKGNSHQLRFNDYRKFGRVRLFRSDEIMQQRGLTELGPDPLKITGEKFIDLFQSVRRMVKPALLDQTFLAGLGNIYADESLYMTRIHPRKLTHKISKSKLVELHKNIRSVLKKSIHLMGTSVDSYAGVNGQPGGFQKYLKVYGKEGEPCPRCGTGIRREKIGSRSAHFCPRCQRLR
jgi:formamidopyrimidine-DNA glycosylase